MTVLKLPLLTDYNVYDFQDSGTIGGYIKNGYVEDKNGRTVVINRPAIDAVGTLPGTPLGIKYWANQTRLFSVSVSGATYNLYVGESATLVGTMQLNEVTSLYWAESGTYMCVFSPTNLASGQTGTAVAISPANVRTDLKLVTNFPSSIERMAAGAVNLDGYLFLLGVTSGRIYNSNLNTPLTWNALDYIGTDMEKDAGVYLAKYRNNIVAFSTYSTEFFFNAGNATGSPLSVRKDIGFRVGCHSMTSVYEDSNYLAWVARTADGDIYIAEMDNYSPKKISTSVIDTNLAELIEAVGGTITLTGMPILGRVFLFLYIKPSLMSAKSYVYDTKTRLWYKWTFNNTVAYPVTTRAVDNGLDPLYCILRGDTPSGIHEVKVGQFQDNYTGAATDIDFQIITPRYRGPEGTDTFLKFVHKLTLMADKTATSAIVYISWTDDNFQTWSPERQIDLQALRGIHRLGHFRERAFKLRCPANVKRIVESLNIDVLIEAV